MSYYLNKKNKAFCNSLNSEIFIDKSDLIKVTNSKINTNDRFMCVTRPRRFGKTMALSMLNAYYSKGCDSKELFNDLNISKEKSYLNHLNKHNVIWIDMASLYTGLNNKENFVNELTNEIIEDLKDAYPNILKGNNYTLRKCFTELDSNSNESFIFLIDEWDVIFREEENNTKLIDDYIMLLRNLFKSSDVSECIDLVYMTGILPMKRYTTQSALNNFNDYDMIDSFPIETCAGFTEDEVKGLCTQYNRDFEEIKYWYNGYTLNGKDLYNPKSVVMAILKNECKDYWTKTSATEAVANYMNYQNGELKDIITRMITGDKITVDPSLFSNDLTKINSIDSALTVLIHLGYLTFNKAEGKCYIPNHEIRVEFERAIKELHWKEIINPISNSMKLYDETLQGNTSFINETLDKNHKDLAGPFNKNKEDILGVIVQISYYSVKQFYNVKKEDTSELGRADITFIPYDNTHIPFIIELKVNSTPLDAINQIKRKEYFNSLGDYHGKVLLLGISYNSETLKHDSKIEIIEI